MEGGELLITCILQLPVFQVTVVQNEMGVSEEQLLAIKFNTVRNADVVSEQFELQRSRKMNREYHNELMGFSRSRKLGN